MTQTISQDTTALASWLANLSTGALKVQITRTVYDLPYVPLSGTSVPINGSNLRNRVAYTAVIDQENTNVPGWRAATFYSYDPHGNVDTLLQDYDSTSVMGLAGNRFKLMTYDYDLVSGKVNQVSYQPGQTDGFYHQYTTTPRTALSGSAPAGIRSSGRAMRAIPITGMGRWRGWRWGRLDCKGSIMPTHYRVGSNRLTPAGLRPAELRIRNNMTVMGCRRWRILSGMRTS
jgi:hypothetical protein